MDNIIKKNTEEKEFQESETRNIGILDNGNSFNNSVTDQELEAVFGGIMLPMSRRTFTRRCPCSIGHCC